MTVTELYDNLSDKELKAALLAPAAFIRIKRLHKKHIDADISNFGVTVKLYEQAATRWLKNQRK